MTINVFMSAQVPKSSGGKSRQTKTDRKNPTSFCPMVMVKRTINADRKLSDLSSTLLMPTLSAGTDWVAMMWVSFGSLRSEPWCNPQNSGRRAWRRSQKYRFCLPNASVFLKHHLLVGTASLRPCCRLRKGKTTDTWSGYQTAVSRKNNVNRSIPNNRMSSSQNRNSTF